MTGLESLTLDQTTASGLVGVRLSRFRFIVSTDGCSTSMACKHPPSPRQVQLTTTVTLATPRRHSKAQLNTWRHTKERHEQIALSQKTLKSKGGMRRWLEEVEMTIEGIEARDRCFDVGVEYEDLMRRHDED